MHVKNLASHVLAVTLKRLADDWEQRYAVRPVLVETFVDSSRFEGTCYRAANWVGAGKTAGRRDGVAKDIFLYALSPDWRETLRAEPPRPALGQSAGLKSPRQKRPSTDPGGHRCPDRTATISAGLLPSYPRPQKRPLVPAGWLRWVGSPSAMHPPQHEPWIKHR